MKKKALDEKMALAVEETLRLYHAWLACLLRRLGEGTLRVPVAELRRALDEVSCSVSREGEDYVIRLGGGCEEASHGVDE